MATLHANRLLVVDDDTRIRDLLSRYLKQEGFDVYTADGGVEMDQQLAATQIDLIILDLMMPGEDGLSICRRLRASSCNLPIIMLTAKGEDVDRIVGLEVGADDYLTKPFNPRELLARVQAVLRRRPAPEASSMASQETGITKFGDFVLDFGARSLSKHGQDIALTSGEFAMLKALAQHPRTPMTREKIAVLARGREYEPFDRSLDVQISRLRKLIEVDAAKPKHIQTVWGIGYVFVPDSEAAAH